MTRDEIAKINPQAILWDGLDDAIVCMAKRIDGVLSFFNSDGEVTLDLDEFHYDPDNYDEGEDLFDKWGRNDFTNVVVYDVIKCIKILAKDMEPDEEELEEYQTIEDLKLSMAMEYFYFNTDGAFVGEFTPIHVMLTEKEEEKN